MFSNVLMMGERPEGGLLERFVHDIDKATVQGAAMSEKLDSLGEDGKISIMNSQDMSTAADIVFPGGENGDAGFDECFASSGKRWS